MSELNHHCERRWVRRRGSCTCSLDAEEEEAALEQVEDGTLGGRARR